MAYQRDLFDTQMDLQDQLTNSLEQPWNTTGKPKEEPQPGSLEWTIARQRRKRQLGDRLRAMRKVYFDAQDRGREWQHERICNAIRLEQFLLDNQVHGTIHDSHMPLVLFRMDNPSASKNGRWEKYDDYCTAQERDGKAYSKEWHKVALQIMQLSNQCH